MVNEKEILVSNMLFLYGVPFLQTQTPFVWCCFSVTNSYSFSLIAWCQISTKKILPSKSYLVNVFLSDFANRLVLSALPHSGCLRLLPQLFGGKRNNVLPPSCFRISEFINNHCH